MSQSPLLQLDLFAGPPGPTPPPEIPAPPPASQGCSGCGRPEEAAPIHVINDRGRFCLDCEAEAFEWPGPERPYAAGGPDHARPWSNPARGQRPGATERGRAAGEEAGMNGLLAHAGRSRCRVPGCGQPVHRSVEIRLPADWTTAGGAPALSLPVAACRLHAAELERRQRALGTARRDLLALTSVLQIAVATTLALRRDLAETELALQAQRRLVEAQPSTPAGLRDRSEEVCA